MKLLFFDCETNGLPIDYKASYEEVNNWPRVISLAWILTDIEGNIIRQQHNLVFPNGWQVPTEPFWTDNGYTQETNVANGIDINIVLDAFLAAKKECCAIIAHNLNFDHRVVWAEFIRNGKQPLSGLHKICTMMKSTSYCGLRGANNRVKWPKLEELYEHLFLKKMDNAHDALADITATKECFFELVKRKVIAMDFVPAEPIEDPFA